MQKVILKVFAALDDVKPAVASGSVDMVYGVDTIGPRQFADLHLVDNDNLKTYVSQPLSTRSILLNSNKPPLNSLAVRKAVIHAIHKQVSSSQLKLARLSGCCTTNKYAPAFGPHWATGCMLSHASSLNIYIPDPWVIS